MEILTTAIVEEKTLNVGDTFDIGNGISIIIHELFDNYDYYFQVLYIF